MKYICFNLSINLAVLVLMLAVLAAPGLAPAAETGFTGMQVQGMSVKIANALGRKSLNGVLVRDVALGGPSDRAGFRRGDLILEYGGKKIENFDSLVKATGTTKPGQKL